MVLELEKLLDEFEKIEKPDFSNPTLLEIAGYPHFENVCSNILSFYFDAREPHGLQDLLIQSILNCVNFDFSKKNIDTTDVSREFVTDDGKRIDIVIECEDVIIAIENKIWAPINNDLESYSRFIDKKFKENEKIKIVLSVRSLFKDKESGFINVTYQEFFDEVTKNIGAKLIQAHPKFITHFTDFMESILKLTKSDEMTEEILIFFARKNEIISKLFEEKRNLDSFILRKIKGVQAQINLDDLPKTNQWIYQKSCLVHDIELENDIIIAVDCYFNYEGIEIKVWIRQGSVDKTEYLKKLIIYSEGVKLENETLVIPNTKEIMSLLTSDNEIAKNLNDVLLKIKKKE